MKKTKEKVLILSLVLILTVTVGSTLAYLMDTTEALENTFNPSQVSCSVAQSDDTYTVKNTGDIAAYIRVAVVVNYVDANGDICYVENPPAATVSASGLTKNQDGYYYSGEVQPNGTVTITVLPGAAEGYTAQVEIVAQAIQSVPTNVVTEAWGYTPGN